ncbi:MAG: phosphate/sulfate permease [Bacteroidetes bacterium]|nr:phosphate/sulfate permease [Bacteroidota bacterium]
MTLLIALIVLALVFDFINGFHDSANSIATVVSTRVLTPLQAVIWAAFFNFVAYLIPNHGVANTVKGMVNADVISLSLLIGGLIGATIWNLLTWWWGLPSSSSHALLGGLTGAAFIKAGAAGINAAKLKTVLAFIPLAPVMGMVATYIIAVLIINICKNLPVFKVDKYFRRLQLVSSALFSIGHGGNDAQKTMGVIWAGLICYSAKHSDVPSWLYVAGSGGLPKWAALGCFTAMGLGTLVGGWRIVKTMGQRITALKPFEGFCAETAGALTLFLVNTLGIPVSTTHTITGSIMGAGMTKRLSAVRWGVAGNIVWAWILTIPASAAMGAAAYYILEHFTKA